MKLWIACGVLAVFLFGLTAFVLMDNLTLTANSFLIPKENIVFSVLNLQEDEKIFCGKNWNGQYSTYTLEIKSKNNENFKNPKLLKSSNVTILQSSGQSASRISINFFVTSDAKISFELTTDNFEKASQSFEVVPFVNTFEIQFTNLYDEDNSAYSLATQVNGEKEELILYYVENSMDHEQATKDKYPCTLSYLVFVNGQPFENCTLVSSNQNILKTDNSAKIITAKNIGTANISFSIIDANQKSVVLTTLYFKIKNVPIEQVTNFPENEIEIDLANSNKFNFAYEIFPQYASDYNIVLSENSKTDIVSFNKAEIIGLKTGEVELYFIINSEVFKTIKVKVFNTQEGQDDEEKTGSNDNENPDEQDDQNKDESSGEPQTNIYSFEVNLITTFNGVNFNETNFILDLNLNEIGSEFILVRFEISLKDSTGQSVNPTFEASVLEDESNIYYSHSAMNNGNFILILTLKKAVGSLLFKVRRASLDAELILTVNSHN